MRTANAWKVKPTKTERDLVPRTAKKHTPFQNAIRIRSKEVKNGQQN